MRRNLEEECPCVRFFHQSIVALLQLVPFGDLSAWRFDHFVPMFLGHWTLPAVGHLGANLKLANQFVPRHAIVVVGDELQLNILQSILWGQIEVEGFIENRVQCALLDVRSLLEQTYALVVNVDLHVGVCGK